MITEEDQIRLFALDFFKTYQGIWIEENFLLSRRFKDDNIKKNVITLQLIERHFKSLRKVALCHTSDSVGLIYLLRKKFDCEIVVLTNHPLFDRVHPLLNDKLKNISYKKIDCIFEIFTGLLGDCDLVIFPEMEYFVPLHLIEHYNQSLKTMCLYYVDDLNNTTEQSFVLCKEDMEEMCSFSTQIEMGSCKNTTGRDFYYGLGIL
jgi:hypothetical protein